MSTMQSQEWTTAGTTSWTVPPGVTHCWATILGAGAGGGRDLPGSSAGGRGGGAGELASMIPLQVTPGASITVVVGAKGAGGFWANHVIPSGGALATVGGDSSFGPYQACGGGNFETGGVAQQSPSFGAGVNGGLQGNPTFPLFADMIAFDDSSRWFGGAGGGAYAEQPGSAGQNAMPGGPAGGRLLGGAGGTDTNGVPAPGPGGGGGATIWGAGGAGGANDVDGSAGAAAGTGGGGAGGTVPGPDHDGAAGGDGKVSVFWIQP